MKNSQDLEDIDYSKRTSRKFTPETEEEALLIKELTKNTLKVESLQMMANEYLSDKVKSFIPLMTLEDNVATDGTPLNVVFMVVTGKERDSVEENLKQFCEKINICAENGDIEYGQLSTICKMDLYDFQPVPEILPKNITDALTPEQMAYFDSIKNPTTTGERYIIQFFPTSRYTIEYLKEKYNDIFHKEGEFPM